MASIRPTARPYCPTDPEATVSLSLTVLLLACWAPSVQPTGEEGEEQAEAGLVFVRQGLIAPADVGAAGQALPEGQVLVERAWQPGEEVEVVGRLRRVQQVAPDHPRCVALFRVGLGGRPATSVRFEADGQRLEIQREGAEALVVDAWTGQPASPEGFAAAPERPSPVPAGCPVERPQQPARVGPDGLRHAVVEGPFTEPSGETSWRVVLLR